MLVLGIFSLMTAVALPNVNISPLLLTRVASIVLLYAAALSYNVLDIQAIGSGVSIYSGLFQVTSVSLSMDTIIFLIGAMILLPWAPAIEKISNFSTSRAEGPLGTSTDNVVKSQHSKKDPFFFGVFTAVPTIAEYPLIILFTTCGASFLVSSADLVSLYLSIELQSFRVYILSTLYRDSESATSAGLKYFLLGGLSSGLILLGSALVYANTGLTNLESIFSILSVNSIDNITSASPERVMTAGLVGVTAPTCIIGLTILVVGFLFKVSAAPFHNWSPDVYDGVPTIVTTWLAIMPKISIFIFLLELQSGLGFTGASLSLISSSVSFDVWKNLLLVSSLLSLIIGTVVGLAQYRIKRLLAYSTISHVGFLLLALAVNSEESIESFLFYIIQYTITNLNAFLVVLAFGYVIRSGNSFSDVLPFFFDKKNAKNEKNAKNINLLNTGPTGRVNLTYAKDGNGSDIQFISDIAGQFKLNPLLGLALTVCLFSMRGVPPLIGFFGKQIVLYSAVHSGYYFLSFVAIIVSVISASYYLKIVRVIHFDNLEMNPVSDTTQNISGVFNRKITNIHSFAIASLTIVIALFVLKPSIILNSTSLLALTLFHY